MKRLIFFLAFLVVVLDGSQSTHHHRRRSSSNLVCVHGEEYAGKCQCKPGYLGHHCELKAYCKSNDRNSDGSCHACQENYEGNYCEKIICEHGIPDENEQKCICEQPYSGTYCRNLTTADVYLYYNSKMVNSIGPFGAITIIPLILIYYGCESLARKRQVKRIGQLLSGNQNVSIDSQALKNLLDDKGGK
uniref:EGF-like domain-containing protein n=1 Tax=Panagrolaimus sp. JU765 TaxID=591449 RepID=A0AC34QLM5_9BILA